jgi:hypothetical protein
MCLARLPFGVCNFIEGVRSNAAARPLSSDRTSPECRAGRVQDRGTTEHFLKRDERNFGHYLTLRIIRSDDPIEL